MGALANINSDILGVFGSAAWIAENIKTVPDDFAGTNIGSEFIRLSIIVSNSNKTNPLQSRSGQLIVDIFVPGGKGPKRPTAIAEKLDSYLVGKVLKSNVSNKGSTQFGSSSLSGMGADKDNPSLFRSTYTIPFDYFGVQ